MPERQPTVRSRELGEGLRAALKGAGFTGRQIAFKLGWSDSRISRLLSGTRGAAEADVSAILALCGVTGEDKARLMRLCKEQHKPGWFQQHGSRLPKQIQTLVDHENKAAAIQSFESMLVPGLLQTGRYARIVIEACRSVPASEVDDRVATRLARRNLFSRERPPASMFFIHEFALRLPVGAGEVMSEQLHELLRYSVRSYITMRVVPGSIGAHAACSGNFTLMEFADIKPIVYLDSETSCLFLEGPEEIAAYRDILTALRDSALDEGQSRDLIRNLAIELCPDRGDHDHLEEEEQLQR